MTTMPAPAVADEQMQAAWSKRDYSLTGPSSRRAVEAGLAAAEWYHTDVPRKLPGFCITACNIMRELENGFDPQGKSAGR